MSIQSKTRMSKVKGYRTKYINNFKQAKIQTNKVNMKTAEHNCQNPKNPSTQQQKSSHQWGQNSKELIRGA